MGLFGKTKKELTADSAEQAESQKLKKIAAEHEWLRELSAPVAKKHFTELFSAFDEVKKLAFKGQKPKVELFNHEDRLMNQVRLLGEEWLAVDRSRLSLEDAHELYTLLKETLPDMAGDYKVMAGNSSLVAALYGYHYQNMDLKPIPMVYSHDKQIIERVSDAFARVTRIRHAQWKKDYASTVPKVELNFPVSLQSNRAVKAAAVRLHKLWVAAGDKPLSVEDQYFVDQVAARYVPDAVKAVKAFSSSGEALQREAQSILVDQLGLMSHRLEAILSSQQEVSLGELHAQVSFLREVTA